MNKNDEMCRIPVTATMRIINGEAVMAEAEYREIPASVIAEFIVRKLGASLVKECEAVDS